MLTVYADRQTERKTDRKRENRKRKKRERKQRKQRERERERETGVRESESEKKERRRERKKKREGEREKREGERKLCLMTLQSFFATTFDISALEVTFNSKWGPCVWGPCGRVWYKQTVIFNTKCTKKRADKRRRKDCVLRDRWTEREREHK